MNATVVNFPFLGKKKKKGGGGGGIFCINEFKKTCGHRYFVTLVLMRNLLYA